jgi:hypothetical protein
MKSGKSLDGDRGKKQIYVKGKGFIDIWEIEIDNDQPVPDDCSIIFVSVTSTYSQRSLVWVDTNKRVCTWAFYLPSGRRYLHVISILNFR